MLLGVFEIRREVYESCLVSSGVRLRYQRAGSR